MKAEIEALTLSIVLIDERLRELQEKRRRAMKRLRELKEKQQ